ncbi:MAG: glutamate mutase L [Gammaproteobacteria bacterium]|nr:glutamate mutase L [Gammaproteobacteria bacterium]
MTVGLVRELTAEAARQTALGAGAKLVSTFAQRLPDAVFAPSKPSNWTSRYSPAVPTTVTAK